MKQSLALLFIVIGFSCQAQVYSTKSTSQLEWLVGKWKRTNSKPGRTSIETWKKDGDRLIGSAYHLNGNDTTYIEKLKIVVKDQELYYVADVPENKSEVYFKITQVSPNGFVCENPQHDFPKKISYQLNGNSIRAVISGDGKEIPYLFERF